MNGYDDFDEEELGVLSTLFRQPGPSRNAAMIAALRSQDQQQQQQLAQIGARARAQGRPSPAQPQATQQPRASGAALPESLSQAGNPYAQRAADLQMQGGPAQQAVEAAARPPDTAGVEAFGRKRSEAANRHLVMALAAQEAGDEFKPVSEHFMKQAAEARKPLDMTGGTLTDQGYVSDPGYQKAIDLKVAEGKVAQIDSALKDVLTLEQRERLEHEKLKQAKIIAEARIAASRENARTIAGGMGGGPAKADFEGYTTQGQRVIQDKGGRNWVETPPAAPGAAPTYQPYGGEVIPKAAHEKSVAAATEITQAGSGATDLLKKVENAPNAFGVLASVTSAIPALLGRSTAQKWVAGMTPEDVALRANFAQAAAEEMKRLYGAAQSQGEASRAAQFLIEPAKDDHDAVVAKLKAGQAYAQDAAKRWGAAVTKSVTERTGLPPGGVPPEKPKADGGTPRVTSNEEYRALPSGTTFVDPKGKTRVKP